MSIYVMPVLSFLYLRIMKRLKELAFSTLCLLGFAACSSVETKQFHGFYADDPQGLAGIYNPERGFRLEIAVDVANQNDVWDSGLYSTIVDHLDQESAFYAADSVSLVQTYFYLTGLVGKDISEENKNTMSVFFDELRRLGKKAVLRFAYETAFMGRAPIGPTKEDILCHCEQLKPFLEANKDVIQVVQAGMIGAWGEWHSSVHHLESSDSIKREILTAICQMVPQGRFVQVRVPEYKNLIDSADSNYRRLSFHDDFIVIKPHRWDGGMSEGTPAFRQIVEQSPYVPVDGELPWGSWSASEDPDDPDSGWIIDGPQTARRLFLQHFTSLSVIHNYKEKNTKDKYSMQYWKETPITVEFLQSNKMPVSDGYFQNTDGTPAVRNVFDYIRDHLGYRIELQRLKFPEEMKIGSSYDIQLTLINRGFSTLYNEHGVYFVLLDSQNRVCAVYPTDADVHDWQPYAPSDTTCTPLVHSVSARCSVPMNLTPGDYQLGLWIPDGSERLKNNPRFAIRCANRDVRWTVSSDGQYGVNVLDAIHLK